MIKPEASTSRPEAVFVLLLLQAMFWFIAGVSAAPFALAGEFSLLGLSLATMLLALGTVLAGIGVLWRRRRARAIAIALEVVCLAGGAIQLWLPIGFNHGPVSLMVNVLLPLTVIVLLRKDREAFT